MKLEGKKKEALKKKRVKHPNERAMEVERQKKNCVGFSLFFLSVSSKKKKSQKGKGKKREQDAHATEVIHCASHQSSLYERSGKRKKKRGT